MGVCDGMIPTEAWVLPRPRPDAYVGSFPLHFEKKLHRLMGEPEKVFFQKLTPDESAAYGVVA